MSISWVAYDLYKDELLAAYAAEVCKKYGLDYKTLPLVTRRRIVHYRCERCGQHPLYHVDYLHTNKPRCNLCGMVIKLGRAKYTRLRKEVLKLARQMDSSTVVVVSHGPEMTQENIAHEQALEIRR